MRWEHCYLVASDLFRTLLFVLLLRMNLFYFAFNEISSTGKHCKFLVHLSSNRLQHLPPVSFPVQHKHLRKKNPSDRPPAAFADGCRVYWSLRGRNPTGFTGLWMQTEGRGLFFFFFIQMHYSPLEGSRRALSTHTSSFPLQTPIINSC